MIKSVETTGTKSYTTTYEYDNNGNQTKVVDGKTGATTTYKYDVYGQLRDTTITKGGEETKTQKNVYNDEGQRISKTENGVTTYYYYEGSNVIYTTDGAGNKTSLNIYGLEENVVASVRYEDEGQHAYSYSKNIQSSTYAVTDEEGYFIVGYKYGDFGETEKIFGDNFYNEICYTGAVYDEMTGLHYLNARYYNPEDAVFLSQDSYRGDKTDSTTWNLYAYCAGNPVKYVDPSGHYVETLWDLYSLGDSVKEFFEDPSLGNAAWAALDVASLIAPIPAGGKVARAADDAVDAVRAGDKVVDGVKGAKKVKVKPKAGKKVKSVKKASKTPKVKSKKVSVKKAAKKKGKSSVVSKLNTGKWNKGSFDSAVDSLNKHFRKHGNEVGASTPEEYLRKAEEFAKNAKKGAKKSKVRGNVEGVIRYKKNGKYIDLAPDGSIISFGKQ